MTEVREHLDVFPFTAPARVLRRDEATLLTPAVPGPLGKLWADAEPVDVVHFDQEYVPQPFAPPRFLYQGPFGRIEWQQMDNRQPIYHRNLDVDEMSYQIAGDRTLMTEFGTAELVPGDFVRIPAGVCHDNWGRKESHIIWYLPEPCAERLPPVRLSEARIPPFEGWQPAVVNEVITDCLGTGPHDTAAQRSDERLIIEDVLTHSERLCVVRPRAGGAADGGPDGAPDGAGGVRGVRWIWAGPDSMVGMVHSGRTAGLDYVRHRNADEIQYQVEGRRLLVTQHGSVELGPGDFARIPIGVAFTSIAAHGTRYIATVAYHRMPRAYEASRGAEQWTAEDVDAYRAALLESAT